MSELPIAAIVVSGLITVVFFGAGLFLVIRMLSRSGAGGGGMAGLAGRYPAQDEPQGRAFSGQSVQIGAITWKRCVRVVVSDQGLYLRARSVFASRPPVLIPWQEITGFENCRLFWQTAGRLSVGNPPVANITLLDPVLEAVRPHLRTPG